MEKPIFDNESVNDFLMGRDPMEHIINLECGYLDKSVKIIYKTPEGQRAETSEPFYPFIWAKRTTCQALCGGDKQKVKALLGKYGINVKALITHYDGYEVAERMEKGYEFMFYATVPMSYGTFLKFFEEAEVPVYNNNKQQSTIPISITQTKRYIAVTPIEQFMMKTGKRLFKGYDDYDELVRMEFDLETEGLDAKRHRINQIGVRTNKGFETIIPIGNGENDEIVAIINFFELIAEHRPDIIIGYNSENFDWDFIITRCEILGYSITEISKRYFDGNPIYKKKNVTSLKLGGETEYFRQTVIPGYNVIDGLHAVRRAQAIDSNMQKASLKYVTQYISANKPNRVYIPGDKIKLLWETTEACYAFNNENGDWYKITNEKPLKENYEIVTGTYIAERYLLDDLYETDAVELRFNQANFLVSKLLPTTFSRACTSGTAALWKMLFLGFSYENNLAIPAEGKKQRFTGGLSRLLSVGYVPNVVKLDYGSLYPSIILTWAVKTDLDVSEVMLIFVEYILSEREKYKGFKKKADKKKSSLEDELKNTSDEKEINKLKKEILKWSGEESKNDKKQLPLKILANSFFGSYGSPDIFNWGDVMCAEKTTCIGRQCLRLMIYVFKKWGYEPIVGDSFTADTPLFIKYKETGLIDIKPINELICDEEINMDALDREYDYSEKDYYVLCRSGWVEPKYIYRHKTDKDIYKIIDGDMVIEVTEDHSLFNEKQEKIKPSEITEKTKLEYYSGISINENDIDVSDDIIEIFARGIINNRIEKIPTIILNANKKIKSKFLKMCSEFNNEQPFNIENRSKTLIAGLQYIKNSINFQYE